MQVSKVGIMTQQARYNPTPILAVSVINPLTAKLFNLNFHPPEVVSR